MSLIITLANGTKLRDVDEWEVGRGGQLFVSGGSSAQTWKIVFSPAAWVKVEDRTHWTTRAT